MLVGPNTWDDFIYVIRTKAERLKVWKLVNPDLEEEPALLSEPRIPPIPESPTMTIEVQNALDAQLRGYQIQQARYERQEKALTTIHELIISSIANKNLVYTKRVTQTPWHILRALKSAIKPTTTARTFEAAARYRQCCKPPKSQNLEAWAQEFLDAYNAATDLTLAEVQGYRPILDFLAALSSPCNKDNQTQSTTRSICSKAGKRQPRQ